MTRVRFTADAVSRLASGDVSYAAGSVHDLDDQMAQRWISRGLAVQVAVRPVIHGLQTEPTLPPVEIGQEPATESALAQEVKAFMQPVSRGRPPGR